MHEKYLKSLEFDKILNTALSYVLCEEARELLQNETPGETAEDVRLLLRRTDEITTLLIKNGSPRFSHVDHVAFTLQRAVKGGVLSMSELLEIAATLRNFRELSGWYHITEHDALSIDDLFYAMTPQPGLEKAIGEAILSETEMADTASDTLYDVRRKIRAAENSIRDKLDHLTKSQANAKYLQESVVSLRNGRFVVPVKAEYRGEIGGVIHDVSSSGSTLFVEPTAVVEANAKILQLRNQEQQEIERILAAFSAQCANLEPMFSFGYEAMLKIDALLAKAHLALEQKAMCPTVRDDVSFSLVRARHPLIDPEKVVPIDVELGRTYDTMVITGPNTGGKTVTLKTAGLLCTMARFGYLIPAHESSEVCVFDDILVDIGDEQSIEQSLSTFSGHMKNITEILACAGPRSLVLMDELGAGTDPAEGAALAVSIIEELREKGAHVMATTHYAEMKTFALETPGVQNASCEFNVETLRPTYRISVGVPGKSNAFLISAKLGISEHIIERAKTHLCIVTNGNDMPKDTNLAQLIAYIQYNNFEVKESKLHSVFDLLYKQYTAERLAYEQAHPVASGYLSENLVHDMLLKGIAHLGLANTEVLCHYPLSRLIADWNVLDEQEKVFAGSPFSHVDFLIYNSLTKRPLQTIEVDGWYFHKESETQQLRDALKDRILTKFGLRPHRISTTATINIEAMMDVLK